MINAALFDDGGVESFRALCERERRAFPRTPFPEPVRVPRVIGRDFFTGCADNDDQPLEQGEPS